MKKIIDERGFLFGKISVIDIMAVALVIALGVMVYSRLRPVSGGGDSLPSDTGKVEVEYVLKAGAISKYIADAVSVDDELFTADSGFVLGTVTGKHVENSVIATNMPDGTVEFLPREDCFDMYLTVVGECTAGVGTYYLDGAIELLEYMGMQVNNTYGTFYASVYSIN